MMQPPIKGQGKPIGLQWKVCRLIGCLIGTDIRNWFAIDNYVNDALVIGYYHDNKSLHAAYLQHDDILNALMWVTNYHFVDDESFKVRRELKAMSVKDKRKAIVKELQLLGNCYSEQEREFKAELRKADPLHSESL